MKTENLHPFDDQDYLTFAGVESKNPLIAEKGDWAVVLDGPELQLHNGESGNSFRFKNGILAENAVNLFLSFWDGKEEGLSKRGFEFAGNCL